MQSWPPIIHTDMKINIYTKDKIGGEKTKKIMQHMYTNTWHTPLHTVST